MKRHDAFAASAARGGGSSTLRLWHVASLTAGLLAGMVGALAAPMPAAAVASLGATCLVAAWFQVYFRLVVARRPPIGWLATVAETRLLLVQRHRETISRLGWSITALSLAILIGLVFGRLG